MLIRGYDSIKGRDVVDALLDGAQWRRAEEESHAGGLAGHVAVEVEWPGAGLFLGAAARVLQRAACAAIEIIEVGESTCGESGHENERSEEFHA